MLKKECYSFCYTGNYYKRRQKNEEEKKKASICIFGCRPYADDCYFFRGGGVAQAETTGGLKVTELQTESLTDPLGLDEAHPSFSWKIMSDIRGTVQTKYQIIVNQLNADGKVEKFGKVEEVITKETLSKLYRVEFEIMEIEGKPLSIWY